MVMIRPCTEKDFRGIEKWLIKECEKTGEGFYCNWSIINEAYQEGRVDAVVETEQSIPVAFTANGLTPGGIMEVRPDKRGRGYGGLMMDHYIKKAASDGGIGLLVDCASETSLKFCEHYGFKSMKHISDDKWWGRDAGPEIHESHRMAYLVLPIRQFERQDENERSVEIVISLGGGWDGSKHKRLYTVRGYANDSRVRMAERFTFMAFHPDSRICISIDGKQVHEDKMKYAHPFGVKRDAAMPYFKYIDELPLESIEEE